MGQPVQEFLPFGILDLQAKLINVEKKKSIATRKQQERR